MDTASWIVVLIIAVGAVSAIAAASVILARRRPGPAPPVTAHRKPPARPVVVGGKAVITLDLTGGDPMSPAVDRLVGEAAEEVLAAYPEVKYAEVTTQGGSVLGRRSRSVSRAGALRIAPLPGERIGGHHAKPDPVLAQEELLPAPPREGPLEVAPPTPEPRRHVPIAERFDLPDGVRARLGGSERPVDLVRAIVEAGGVVTRPEGDLIRVGDLTIVVLDRPENGWITHEQLSHAFLEIEDSGSGRGLVVGFGHLDAEDVRRREWAAPQILHVGPKAVQRMADAVASGGDPLKFVEGPAIERTWPQTRRVTGRTKPSAATG